MNPFHFSTRPRAGALRLHAVVGLVMVAALGLVQPGSGHAATAFEPAQTVQGTPLVLNGSGTRYRAVFKVYDMALYTPRKVKTLEELLALQGPVRLNFVAQRDIPGTDLGLSFIKGLANNSSAEQIRRYTPASNRLIEIFSGRPKLSPGETFAMEYLPGKGTTFYIEGQPQGAPLGDAEYFGMVLRIWLGSVPVDHQLKEALLR